MVDTAMRLWLNEGMNLYTNEQDGRIACTDHVGNYLTAAITTKPNAHRWSTPLGVWARWTVADDQAWIAEFGESATCENCRTGW